MSLLIDSKLELEQLASGAYNSNAHEIGRRAFLIGAGAYVLSACGKGGASSTTGPSTGSSGDLSGRITDLQAARDIITHNQTSIGGSSFRSLDCITRWDLPIAIYVDSSINKDNVDEAMRYWQSAAGLNYFITGTNQEPRILIRQGTDGVGTGPGGYRGRGLIDGTYSNNRARSGLVVLGPEAADCNLSDRNCVYIFRHEIGHALAFLGHDDSGGLMASNGAGNINLSQREINMMRELSKLPHGARVEPNGTWRVVK